MNVRFPYQPGPFGTTATSDDPAHIRGLIEQVLFTTPWERVNRPSFGSGLMQMVFAPNSDALAAATRVSVQGALQQWLGDLIQVQAVDVAAEDSILRVRVDYVVRRTQERQSAQYRRSF